MDRRNPSKTMHRSDQLPLHLAVMSACMALCLFCVDRESYGQQLSVAKDRPPTSSQTAILLQLRSDVELGSYVVRIRDVAVAIGQAPDNWQEISNKAIGLLPTDGRRLRMERQRISEHLDRSGLLQRPIQWSGPSFVSVAYVAGQAPINYRPAVIQTSSAANNARVSASQVAAQTRFEHDSTDQLTNIRKIKASESSFPNLLPAERNRVERMILAAFPKTHAEVLERFEVSIPRDDQGINALKGLRAVNSLRLSESPKSGRIQLWVGGETELRQVEASIDIELEELPVVIFTTTALTRGDILSARDLIAKPIPLNQYDSRLVTEIDSLINKEVVRPLSANRPISEQDFSEPIVIKRGDRVLLRVVGAGVMVSTDARALAPAAVGETVMVETEEPKQKLIARVVRTGVVEIVSRPPSLN